MNIVTKLILDPKLSIRLLYRLKRGNPLKNVGVLYMTLIDLFWFYGISTIVGYFMPNPLSYL